MGWNIRFNVRCDFCEESKEVIWAQTEERACDLLGERGWQVEGLKKPGKPAEFKHKCPICLEL